MSEKKVTRQRTAAAPVKQAAKTSEAPEGLDDLLEDVEPKQSDIPTEEAQEAPTEELPRTRKQAEKELEEAKIAKKNKAAGPKIVPTDDYIRDKKGNIRLDADGDKMQYAPGSHKGVGYVNENGVLFPVRFKFKGGHIGTFGSVVLLKCHECGHVQSVDESRMGVCGRCQFSQIDELEAYELS